MGPHDAARPGLAERRPRHQRQRRPGLRDALGPREPLRPGPQYVRGQRVETFEAAGDKGIRAAGGIGEASYAFGVARSGDYRLRLHLAAPAAAEAEITPAGSENVLRSFSVPAAGTMGWIDAGALHLDPGAYETTVLLLRRRLARLRRAPAASAST